MATSDDVGGGGGEREDEGDSRGARRISSRWLKVTQQTNREAFEREMERQRRRFDGEFRRFWRARRPAI